MAFIDHVPQGFRGLPILSPESQARRDIVDTARAIGHIVLHPNETKVSPPHPEGDSLQRCLTMFQNAGLGGAFVEVFGPSGVVETMPGYDVVLRAQAFNRVDDYATQSLPELPQ